MSEMLRAMSGAAPAAGVREPAEGQRVALVTHREGKVAEDFSWVDEAFLRHLLKCERAVRVLAASGELAGREFRAGYDEALELEERPFTIALVLKPKGWIVRFKGSDDE